ncbi:MAG: quinolinate phosphoribosyl transferase [Eubacteriales bacterium]
MEDIRDIIFKDILNQEFQALLIPERKGCFSGVEDAFKQSKLIGVKLDLYLSEGETIEKGKPIGMVTARPKQIALAEEKIIGMLSKFSGIATAAKKAMDLSRGKMEIVSGSWKKMPPAIKDGIRTAILAGGASFRITNDKMIYMDKNYIRMLGSIPKALDSVKNFKDHTKVIQIKGKKFSVREETEQALTNGCSLLMVDTGNLNDLIECSETVKSMGLRNQVKIAFAGGVKLDKIEELCNYDIDLLCIGKEIVDAQLLDIKLDVI